MNNQVRQKNIMDGAPLEQIPSGNKPSTNLRMAPPTEFPRKTLSAEGWEELKPMIYKLYIEENMKLRNVANAIFESHGFLPTKRQFGARLAKWGFKKNASLAERQAMVEESKAGRTPALMGGGTVKFNKIARWKKELDKASQTEQIESHPVHFGKPFLGLYWY